MAMVNEWRPLALNMHGSIQWTWGWVGKKKDRGRGLSRTRASSPLFLSRLQAAHLWNQFASIVLSFQVWFCSC